MIDLKKLAEQAALDIGALALSVVHMPNGSTNGAYDHREAARIVERYMDAVVHAAPPAEQGAAALAWVAVAERLPEVGQEVLIWGAGRWWQAIWHSFPNGNCWWIGSDDGYEFSGEVTHWCAITAPVARPAAEQAAG